MPVTIVMPEGTPFAKINGTRSHGATVVIEGLDFTGSTEAAKRLEAEKGFVFVSAFDDASLLRMDSKEYELDGRLLRRRRVHQIDHDRVQPRMRLLRPLQRQRHDLIACVEHLPDDFRADAARSSGHDGDIRIRSHGVT